jgi:Transposase IS66 family
MAAYEHVGSPKMVHAACWAHARRKFFQAAELNPKDQLAVGIVAQIDELFNIDQRAHQRTYFRRLGSPNLTPIQVDDSAISRVELVRTLTIDLARGIEPWSERRAVEFLATSVE